MDPDRLFGPLALGSIFFISGAFSSLLFWLALLRNVPFLVSAAIGIIAADLLSLSLTKKSANRSRAALRANAVLTCLAIAWLTQGQDHHEFMRFGLIAAAAAASCIASAAIGQMLRKSDYPALVWAYCAVIAAILLLVPASYVHVPLALVDWSYPVGVWDWPFGVLKAIGILFYLPDPVAGLLIVVAILAWSRTMFVCGLLGLLAGVAVSALINALGLTYNWLWLSHNFITSAMFLSAIVYLPGRNFPLIAVIAGASAAAIAGLMQGYFPNEAWIFLPLPAGLTIWIGIAALSFFGKSGDIERNMLPHIPPEEAYWRTRYWFERAGNAEPLFLLPVGEPAKISQGFRGKLSHRDQWQHALDFQRIEIEQDNEAQAVSVPSMHVFAPAAGTVVRVRADVPDNFPGVANYSENWGNYVIVQMDQGDWYLVAHLRQGTPAVAVGARVEIGAYLGEMGNSGRSPYPHVHLQAQSGPEPDAPTRPFRLANYFSSRAVEPGQIMWNSATVPALGAAVYPAPPNPAVAGTLNNLMPGTALWQVLRRGNVPGAFEICKGRTVEAITISLDPNGVHRFTSQDGGSLWISVGPDALRVTDMSKGLSPVLKLLAFGMPSIPFAAYAGTRWEEPVPLVPEGSKGGLKLFVASFEDQPFVSTKLHCARVPGAVEPGLVIETTPPMCNEFRLERLTLTIHALKGPVRLDAHFEEGSLSYSLVSFQPGAP